MRISAKGRYGLAAMLAIVDNDSEFVPVTTIAEDLGLSKIYLEQIFAILRKNGILISSKGAQGGYRLSRDAGEIDVYQILSALEQTLFEKTESDFSEKNPVYEQTLQDSVFLPLDETVKSKLSSISLKMLADQAKENAAAPGNFMYYI